MGRKRNFSSTTFFLFCGTLLGIAPACTLSPQSSHTLSVTIPDMRGSRADTYSLARSFAQLNVPSGMPSPTAVSSFSCFALMVTGSGIEPNQALLNQCNSGNSGMTNSTPTSTSSPTPTPMPGYSPGANMPSEPGILSGFVPITGGSMDVQVPEGPARLVQLIGVQSALNPTCPAISDLLSSTVPMQGNSLGDPVELGRATVDVFQDATVDIKAAFNPASPQVVFNCGNNGGPSPTPTPTLVSTGMTLNLDAALANGLAPPSSATAPTGWTDMSGFGDNATLNSIFPPTSATSWSTSVPYSLDIVNTNSCTGCSDASFSYSTNLNSTNSQISVDAWVLITTFAAAYTGSAAPIVANFGQPLSAYYDGYELGYDTSGHIAWILYAGNGTGLTTPNCSQTSVNTIPLNTWTHIAATYNGSNTSLYINGNLDSTAPCTGSLTPTNWTTLPSFYLGYTSSPSVNAAEGLDISIFHYYDNYALTQSDVRNNCANYQSRFSTTPICTFP